MDYKQAGVDIEAGNALVEQIKPVVKKTMRPEVLTGLGGFGACFELPCSRYRQPVLVSGTDGVGTKLKLAMQLNQHETIGIDLVAMCVNDIVVSGAEPLFFLDYYATGHLSVEQAKTVISGIAAGCEQAGCALIGGETAEMPSMYQGEDYDLAGFCVGIVEKEQMILPERVQAGDLIIGLASSGPHSNGYSLIRKLIEISGADLDQELTKGQKLGSALLEPTRIYVQPLLQLMQQISIHGLAHITGGGITENLPRVLPAGLGAQIDLQAWSLPPVFQWLQQQGEIEQAEMLRTFNCGIGMMVIIDPQDKDTCLSALADFQPKLIGQIVPKTGIQYQ